MNDKHCEIIEKATSKPIKCNSTFVYIFKNGEQFDEKDVKEIGLDRLVTKNGYVEEIVRKEWGVCKQ